MKIKTYREFFPYYLNEHKNPLNRSLHYFGTTMAVLGLLLTFLTRKWELLAILPFLGYGPAWIGHFFIEKNRPATFTYPLWSLRGDFHMLLLWLTRRLEK